MKQMFKVLISVLLTLAYSCNNAKTNSKTISTEKIRIDNQGLNIAYDDTKTGDTCLLFVHGWNINKTYWEKQKDFFQKKYRVVAIDLPGFGKSGKNRQNWTVENYASDVTTIINKLNLHNIILIGHSMSGAIVLETALRNPTKVIGIVGVDNFKNFAVTLSPEVKKDITEAYKALKVNYKAIAVQYANESLFSPSTDSAVKKRVISDFLNADSILSAKILETNDEYPIDEKLKTLGKTLFLINSSWHPTDTSMFVKYHVPFNLLSVGPTGHYPMIENPIEFNKRLEDVIDKIGKHSE